MGNPEHLDILKQGVHVWNKWANSELFTIPDLSGADLSYLDLSDANLWAANLSNANISLTNFAGANLSGSQLFSTKFYMVNLNGANLQEACFFNTQIINMDLRDVKNLDKAKHFGPSFVDISTIYESNGKIPKSFLRGIGIPDRLIDSMAFLVADTSVYQSCFISYSSKDEDFANQLYADLQDNRVRCWFAPEDMKIGDKIRDQIDQSIKVYDKLLLVMSKHSLNSNWVEDEVESAYEQEQARGKTVLFPIKLDDAIIDTDKAWATKLIRSRHIGNFTKWKDHDSYKKAFDRLLRDLKAEG